MSYSKRHYRLISNGGPDSKAQAEERVRRAAACDQAHREALEKFGPVTAENFEAFETWQQERMRELGGIS